MYPPSNNVLEGQDPEINAAIQQEFARQANCIELIASENITSQAVMQAMGSVMTNKYAEGYPGKRYYGGCLYVDKAEALAIERVKQLFGVEYANVQPHSGANANQAVFFAFLQPGDAVSGLALSCGGHLTHGASMTQSGKWFNSAPYHVKEDGLIDYDELEEIAHKHKPKMIIAGVSSYSRVVDWARVRKIADGISAMVLADISHLAGLIVSGIYPSPIQYADVITSTTHKTLRGPRGGVILWNNPEFTKKINSAVFPGMQGGPLMHVIAAKAVAFKEAMSEGFTQYSKQVLSNARVFAQALTDEGLKVVTGGTDCHMFVVDLSPLGLTGKEAERILDEAGLTCNKNVIPFDKQTPFVTSGLRLGTPAGTTRGFKEEEFRLVAKWMVHLLKVYKQGDQASIAQEVKAIKGKVQELCAKFPIYQ